MNQSKKCHKKLNLYLGQNQMSLLNYRIQQIGNQQVFIFANLEWSEVNQNYIKQFQKLYSACKKFSHVFMAYNQQQHIYFINLKQSTSDFRTFIQNVLSELQNKDFKHVIFPFLGYLPTAAGSTKKQIKIFFQECVKFLNSFKSNISFQYQSNQYFIQAAQLFQLFLMHTTYDNSFE